MEQEKRELLQANVIPKLVDVMETMDELMLTGRYTFVELGEFKRIKQLTWLARDVAQKLLNNGGKQ